MPIALIDNVSSKFSKASEDIEETMPDWWEPPPPPSSSSGSVSGDTIRLANVHSTPTLTKSELALSLCIPPDLASKAIGHKGCVVKRLRLRTGCSIHIQHLLPGTNYQVMRVKSHDKTLDQFLGAVQEILAIVVAPGIMTSRPWNMVIAVSSTLAPVVKTMRQCNSCYVEVRQPTACGDEHIMSIEGYTWDIISTLRSILCLEVFQ
jgi:hypothetical protein